MKHHKISIESFIQLAKQNEHLFRDNPEAFKIMTDKDFLLSHPELLKLLKFVAYDPESNEPHYYTVSAPITSDAPQEQGGFSCILFPPMIPRLIREKVDEYKSRFNCFLATAAYGSNMSDEVIILRKFRDTCLLQHRIGRFLTALYYRYSPALASSVSSHPIFRFIVRALLLPLVYFTKWFL